MTTVQANTKRITGILASLGLLALVSTSVIAAESRTLSQSYAYNGQSVSLDMDIGSAKFIATDSDEVKVEVVVEDSDSHWLFFWRNSDVDSVSIDSSVTAKKMSLKLSEQDNIEQQWTVYIPKQAALSLEVGIGDIEVTGLSNDIEIALGVGSAKVEHQTSFGSIDLDSGIGDVSISEQGKHLTVKENLVAQSYTSKSGTGKGILSINVGVGEIVVVKL